MIIHFDNVPFYSQFRDIPRIEWRSESCGIASLAMALEFYKPNSVSVPKLLVEALKFGAYQPGVGWKHSQLASLAGLYGLVGTSYDFSKMGNQAAFNEFKQFLGGGPMVVSIHNKFNPKASLGHLVVVTGIENDIVYYHDPAGNGKEKAISISGFLAGWKKRFITVREKQEVALGASAIGNNS